MGPFVSAESIRLQGSDVVSSVSGQQNSQTNMDGCVLDDIPSKLADFKENTNRILQILETSTQNATCRLGTGDNAQGEQYILQGASTKNVIQAMDSKSGDIGTDLVSAQFYYRNTGAVPDYLLVHQRYLQEIHGDILTTAVQIGQRCAGGFLIGQEADLIGNEEKRNPYTISGRSAQSILNDLSSNLRDIVEFTQSLSLGQYADILDESLIPVAPIGFDEQVRAVYDGTDYRTINECELAQPETQKMLARIDSIHAGAFKNEEAKDVMVENALRRKFANGIHTPTPSQVDTNYLTVVTQHRDGFSTTEAGQKQMIQNADGKESTSGAYHDYIATSARESALSGQRANADRWSYLLRDVFQFMGIGDESEWNQSDVESATTFLPLNQSDPYQDASGTTPIPIGDFDEIDSKTIAVVLLQNSLNQAYQENVIRNTGPAASEFAASMAPLANTVYYLSLLTELSLSNKQIACDILGRQAINVYPHNCSDLENEIRGSQQRKASTSSSGTSKAARKIIGYERRGCNTGSCQLVPIYE